MSDVDTKLRNVVADQLDVDPDRLTPEARLGDDLCVDSLAAVELAMVLEDEFEISLPEEVLAGVRTYGDVVKMVTDQTGGA